MSLLCSDLPSYSAKCSTVPNEVPLSSSPSDPSIHHPPFFFHAVGNQIYRCEATLESGIDCFPLSHPTIADKCDLFSLTSAPIRAGSRNLHLLVAIASSSTRSWLFVLAVRDRGTAVESHQILELPYTPIRVSISPHPSVESHASRLLSSSSSSSSSPIPWNDLLILISGTDRRFHAYIPSQPLQFSASAIAAAAAYQKSSLFLAERQLSTVLTKPEELSALEELPAGALCYDSCILPNNSGVATAIGLQNGFLRLYSPHSAGASSSHSLTAQTAILSGPISDVAFFSPSTVTYSSHLSESNLTTESAKALYRYLQSKESDKKDCFVLHLIVAESTGRVSLYKDVLMNGLSRSEMLLNSDKYDAITSMALCNIGSCHRLLIGTYGQHLLSYSYSEANQKFEYEGSRRYSSPVLNVSILKATNAQTPLILISCTDSLYADSVLQDEREKMILKRAKQLKEHMEAESDKSLNKDDDDI